MARDSELRISGQGLRVLKLFLDRVRKERAGAEISRETGIGAGTLYPLLSRFEKAGMLVSKWEVEDPSSLGRPRRRLYKITGAGIKSAQVALAGVQVRSGELGWI